jgi:hypothetical protein
VELRLTEDEALDLARQIVAEAEVKTEITNETPPQEPI